MTCDTLIRKHIGNENQLPQYMTKMHLQGKECFTLEDADEFKQLLTSPPGYFGASGKLTHLFPPIL
jgi:hypothetical protein